MVTPPFVTDVRSFQPSTTSLRTGHCAVVSSEKLVSNGASSSAHDWSSVPPRTNSNMKKNAESDSRKPTEPPPDAESEPKSATTSLPPIRKSSRRQREGTSIPPSVIGSVSP